MSAYPHDDVLVDPADVLDPELGLEFALAAEVDRAVSRYERKKAGRAPFTDFAAMLPADLRGAA